jgi:hypothetical protein
MALTKRYKEEPELKKHINAIHCTNDLRLVQRKLFNALLYNAYADLPKQSQFEISARELCKLIGYNSNDHKNLKKAVLELVTTAIEWDVISSDSDIKHDKWKISSILAAVELEKGICTYEYSTLMRELFFRPEVYGRINMEVMAKFKSSYGLALYENCIRFQGLKQTPWFTVDVFRKLMGVTEDKYTAFCDFKKRVIDVGVREVNQHSSIEITPEIKRRHAKIESIRFKLSPKTVLLENTACLDTTGNTAIVKFLIETFGLSNECVSDLLTKYELDYIQEKIKLVTESKSFRLGKIDGLAGYLIKALQKDYKPNKSSKSALNQEKFDPKRENTKSSKLQNENADRNSKNKQIMCVFTDLPEDKKSNLILSFKQFLGKSLYMDTYNRDGFTNILIQDQFCEFIRINGIVLSKDFGQPAGELTPE